MKIHRDKMETKPGNNRVHVFWTGPVPEFHARPTSTESRFFDVVVEH